MGLISHFATPLPQADVFGQAIAGFDQGRKDRRNEDALMKLANLGQPTAPVAPGAAAQMMYRQQPGAPTDALTSLVNGSHSAAAAANDPALSEALSAKGYETPQVHGTNSARAMQYFINNGYSPHQAAGIVGNLMQESGPDLNVAALNPGDGADGSNSVGVAQWNGERAQALNAYAAANNLDINDLETQLGFINHELGTTESAARAALMQATNPIEAAAAFAGYERPAGWTPENPYGAHGWGNRAQNAAILAGTEYAPTGSPVGWSGGPQGASPFTFDPETMQALLMSEETRPLALSLIEKQQGINASQGRMTIENWPDGSIVQRDTLTGEVSILREPATPTQRRIVQGPDGNQYYEDGSRVLPGVEAATAPADQPTEVREYEYAKSQGYEGTFQEYQIEMKRAGATNIDMNNSQALAGGYADRMSAANTILDDPDLTQAQMNMWQQGVSAVPGVGNLLTSEPMKLAQQAQRDFINAILRRESGAAIAQSEFDNAAKQYFPQPGDTPAVIEQKRRNRLNAINGVSRAAGPAYQPPSLAPGGGDEVVDFTTYFGGQ